MRKIVFDIETQNFFPDVGKRDPVLLDISLLAIHDSKDNSYKSFLHTELGDLWPILEKADLLIGYNSEHFDIPLLNKYYPGDLTQIKHVDLMKEIKKSLGRRIGLDAVAKATLGIGKSGHASQGLVWWKNGEIEKLRDYCIQDVKITKELYEYALTHGHIKYEDRGVVKEIKLDTTWWEKQGVVSMTHTMPF